MSDKATIFEAQCEVLHVYYNNAENKLVCTNCLFITTNTRAMMHHVGLGNLYARILQSTTN